MSVGRYLRKLWVGAVLFACLPATAMAQENVTCQTLAESACQYGADDKGGPHITAEGIVATVEADQKKTDYRLTVNDRKAMETNVGTYSVDSYCPKNICRCEKNVMHLVLKGDGAGIARINAREEQEAASHQCGIDYRSVDRKLLYVYASKAFVSTSVYAIDFCVGCGGGCHGNAMLTTYDVASGTEYKVKDVVHDLPALRKAVVDNFVARYVVDSEFDAKAVAADVMKEITQTSPIENATIYVEGKKVFVNVGGFILSCAGGAFYPVEIPRELIKPSFLERM